MRLTATVAAVLFLFVSLATPSATARAGKVRAAVNPASVEEIAIPSGAFRMNGFLYLAAGRGPHPVVIFLHGYPGNERNLDLAQAVRRAGYQALYFDYRGSWGSGGTFSFANGLEDVKTVLAWVRNPANAARYRFDTSRIALVGHSYGGWLALMTAAHESPDLCVAALAAWNVGWGAQRFAAHPEEESAALEYFRFTTDPAGGPIRASADDLMKEIRGRASEFDYVAQATAHRDRRVLLVAATRDSQDSGVERMTALARAIRSSGGRNLRTVIYDDDHSFSSHRLELASLILRWLDGSLGRGKVTAGA